MKVGWKVYMQLESETSEAFIEFICFFLIGLSGCKLKSPNIILNQLSDNEKHLYHVYYQYIEQLLI